jgi:hypothetical protein
MKEYLGHITIDLEEYIEAQNKQDAIAKLIAVCKEKYNLDITENEIVGLLQDDKELI